MLERLMLAVKVGQEMLCRLGEMQYRFKIDNLGCHARHCRKITCEQAKIAKIFLNLFKCYLRF